MNIPDSDGLNNMGSAPDSLLHSSSKGGSAGQHIRVLIADELPRSRGGLRAVLATWPQVEVVGEAADGRETVRLVEERRPDVVLMDVRMPVMDGIEATRLIKNRWPEVRVVVLTMYAVHRAGALAAGADAFLVKGCSPEQLLEAILYHEQPHR